MKTRDIFQTKLIWIPDFSLAERAENYSSHFWVFVYLYICIFVFLYLCDFRHPDFSLAKRADNDSGHIRLRRLRAEQRRHFRRFCCHNIKFYDLSEPWPKIPASFPLAVIIQPFAHKFTQDEASKSDTVISAKKRYTLKTGLLAVGAILGLWAGYFRGYNFSGKSTPLQKPPLCQPCLLNRRF